MILFEIKYTFRDRRDNFKLNNTYPMPYTFIAISCFYLQLGNSWIQRFIDNSK